MDNLTAASQRHLIVGLGNPGREYAGSRHNIGFQCLDALAEAHGLGFSRTQARARLADGLIAGRRVSLAKPQTYMNLSGTTVGSLVEFYRIPLGRLLVICDDLDTPLGTLRIRPEGGAGGQKGLASIIQRLGSPDFPRIRFGIGRPPARLDPTDYVLRPFDPYESIIVLETIARVIQAVQLWLTEGIDMAMNRQNGSAEEVAARLAPRQSDS